jgi:hypothetical protein
MNSIGTTYIFVSKYSPACKDIIDYYEPQNYANLELIFVDSREARDIIHKNNINQVPVVVHQTPKGQITVYQFPNMSQWIFEKLLTQIEGGGDAEEEQQQLNLDIQDSPPVDQPQPQSHQTLETIPEHSELLHTASSGHSVTPLTSMIPMHQPKEEMRTNDVTKLRSSNSGLKEIVKAMAAEREAEANSRQTNMPTTAFRI